MADDWKRKSFLKSCKSQGAGSSLRRKLGPLLVLTNLAESSSGCSDAAFTPPVFTAVFAAFVARALRSLPPVLRAVCRVRAIRKSDKYIQILNIIFENLVVDPKICQPIPYNGISKLIPLLLLILQHRCLFPLVNRCKCE